MDCGKPLTDRLQYEITNNNCIVQQTMSPARSLWQQYLQGRHRERKRVGRKHNTTIRFVYGCGRYDRVSSFRDAEDSLLMGAVCRILTCGSVHQVLLTTREPLGRESDSGWSSPCETRARTRYFTFLGPPLRVRKEAFLLFRTSFFEVLPCDLEFRFNSLLTRARTGVFIFVGTRK